jgi:hypothetical protein
MDSGSLGGFKRLIHNNLISALGTGFLIAGSIKACSDYVLNNSNRESLDWVQYYSLIALLPLSVIFISFISNKSLLAVIKGSLFFFYFLSVLVLYWNLYNFLLSLCSSLVIIFFLRKSSYAKENILLLLLAYNSFFLIVSKIAWWQDLWVLLAFDPYTLAVFFMTLTFTSFCFLKDNSQNISSGKTFVRIIRIMIPLCLFFAASLACKEMVPAQVHHWGCYTGTAELIRQGGYLLWSVPSQYGFLSILSIAFFPVESCWQAFWIIQIIFLVTSSMMVFYILYSFRKTHLNYFLSIIITLCAVFLFPGWVPELWGVNFFPSVGPFRFFWLYVILFFVVIQCQSNFFKNKEHENYLGSFIWIIGCMWSFESAYYVSCVWFSYLFFSALLDADEQGQRRFLRAIGKNLITPVLFLAGTVSILYCFYWIRLSEMPDFYSYAEHALSFKDGFGGIAISLKGGFGLLVLLLVFIITEIAAIIGMSGSDRKRIPFLAALYAGFWAIISYFVGRSHENNISNLMPLIIFIAGSLLLIRKNGKETSGILLKLMIIQFYTMVVTLTIGNLKGMEIFLPMIKMENLTIESTLPDVDPDVSAAMRLAGITPKDSIVYLDYTLLLPDVNKKIYHYWLPVNPATIYDPLSKERIKLYIQRFSKQFRSGGYLISRDNEHLKIKSVLGSCFDPVGPSYRWKDISIQRYALKNNYLIYP